MQFSQVIGNGETKTQLRQMVQQNRLSHALLFLGKEGSGALSMARALAQFVLCERVTGKSVSAKRAEPSLFGEPEPPENSISEPLVAADDSCGICPACQKASQLIHPDIHFSFPVIPSKPGDKPISSDYIREWREFISAHPYGNSFDWLQFINAENKQGNITAYECEDILRKMSLKSFESGYKVLVMWMPEMLGKEGNKLLKLIEEPAPNTLFILVAENESLILPTIISRTQLVKIPMPAITEVEAALVATSQVSPQKARQLAALSHGNFRESLQMLGDHDEDNWEVTLRDWLNSIVKTGPQAQVKWIDDISKIGREKQKQFLKYFIHLLEQSVRIQVLGIPADEAGETTSTVEFAIKFNKLCEMGQLDAIIQELDKATYYIERNANAKILFHALTIKLYHIISNKSVILV